MIFNDHDTWICLYYKLNIHAVWLVLTYNLSEDRHIDEITTTCIFHHTKQINSMLPWACSVTDHTSDTFCYTLMCSFFFCTYHILTSSLIYYTTEATQNLFVKQTSSYRGCGTLAFPPAIVDWNMYPMIKQPQTDLINIVHQILWTLCVGLLLREISQMMAVPIRIAVG